MLQGVYEENLKMDAKPVPIQAQRTYPLLWGGGVFLAVSFMLVFMVGTPFRGYSDPLSDLASSSKIAGGEVDALGYAGGREGIPTVSPAGTTAVRSTPLDHPEELQIANLFDLKVKTIVIDPGHGGKDPGAIGRGGVYEKTITMDVARRLKTRLELGYGYRILLTREEDVSMSLRERVAFGSAKGADLFISLHVNYIPGNSVVSIETYYFGAKADANSLRLAERENKGSEYSVAEFNTLISELGSTVKLQESKRLAMSIQQSMYRNSHAMNADVHDWGVKSAPFFVLLGSTAPGVLAEIGVISNIEEEEKLNTGEHRELLAMFLEEGIVNYLNPRSQENEPIEGATEYASKEK